MEPVEVNEDNNFKSKEILQPLEANNQDAVSKEDDGEEKQTKNKIMEEISNLVHEQQLLLSKREKLQQKLGLFLEKSAEKDYFGKSDLSEDLGESTFRNLLDAIENKRAELNNIPIQSQEDIAHIKKELEEKKGSLLELKSLFRNSVQTTALQAVDSESGEQLTPQDVNDLLTAEEEVFQSLQELQLESIQKRHFLNSAENEKINLAEGPLDFTEYEMMSIETQNNREIIQPMSEEIKNIILKASNTINVLSHLEQKLYLAQKEKTNALSQETVLEEELNEMEKKLFNEKIEYNKMKQESTELQQKFILLQHPHLIEDYDAVHKKNQEGKKELEHLKAIYDAEKKAMKN